MLALIGKKINSLLKNPQGFLTETGDINVEIAAKATRRVSFSAKQRQMYRPTGRERGTARKLTAAFDNGGKKRHYKELREFGEREIMRFPQTEKTKTACLLCIKHRKHAVSAFWRRRWDSNPRGAFNAYTISSRAPSTS